MKRIPTFCLFMLMVVFSPLAIDVFLPAVPQMATELATPTGSVQAIVAIFILSMGFGQLLAGPLSDRYGRKPLAMTGVVIYFIAALGCAWAVNVEMLWAMRVLQGFGTCAIAVAAYSGVRDRYQGPKLAAIYSYLNGVICVIPALAPMLGGVITETLGWRANFELMALYALVVGIILWRGLPETRPDNTVVGKRLLSISQYRPILAHPQFQFYVAQMTLTFTIILAYVSYSPDVLMVQMQQSPLAFSMWFGSNAAINIAGAFLAPTVVKHLGNRRSLLIGVSQCALAAVAVLAGLNLSHPLAFMAPVYLASLGFCIILAISSGSAMAPFGERAGTASALLGMLQMSGAAILLGLISLLPMSPQACLAFTMVLPALWWLLFSRRRGYALVKQSLQS
ncbi:multidrug effflux MFS transporter [uncultured Ferrimonas sp.]|uniref:multidrug effflux MFS transporter n=1 Tax=uncultured Ferrimonas sp. TaxID=432640 RepID=UPI0026293F07|nr:multidrug effflux MFS transporter [uncultured Ferrimonas sp.]